MNTHSSKPRPGPIRFIAALCILASLALLGAAWVVTQTTFQPLPPWLQVAGNLHPVVLHLPIGIFMYVIFAEGINLVMSCTRSSWRIGSLRIAVGFGSLMSFVAASFGLILFMQGEYEGDLIMDHLWWGVGFAICSSMVLMLALATRDDSKRYRVILLSCVALMTVAGHYGGLITHGDPLRPLKKTEPPPPHPLAELLIYEDVVTRILEAKCFACHSEGKKKKGGLLVDSYEALLEGGDTGEALIPGDLEFSLMIESIHRPLEEDEHMPPEGKPQLTEEEIHLLEHWVAGGAPQHTKVLDTKVSTELLEWLAGYMSAEKEEYVATDAPAHTVVEADE